MSPKRYNVWKVVYQLKISLCIDEDDEFEPKIWRRIQIQHKSTFSELNSVIQTAMGWKKNLPHRFIVQKSPHNATNTHLEPIEDNDFYCTLRNEEIELTKHLNLVERHLYYHYNSGDEMFWDHVVELEMVLPQEIGTKYPVCVDGERCVPPDDCRGDSGYCKIVSVVVDPEHEEYDEVIKRFGWFDPDGFSVESVNLRLK